MKRLLAIVGLVASMQSVNAAQLTMLIPAGYSVGQLTYMLPAFRARSVGVSYEQCPDVQVIGMNVISEAGYGALRKDHTHTLGVNGYSSFSTFTGLQRTISAVQLNLYSPVAMYCTFDIQPADVVLHTMGN